MMKSCEMVALYCNGSAFEERLKSIGRAFVLRCIAFEWLFKGICIALHCICIVFVLRRIELHCTVFVLRRIAFYYICISNGLSIRYLAKKDEFN